MYTLPYFGEIAPDKLDNYYDAELSYKGREIDTDIMSESGAVDVSVLEKIAYWLSDIARLDTLGMGILRTDFDSGSDVHEYIEIHQEELKKSDLKKLMKGSKGDTEEEKLLAAIELRRIGFSPETPERFITLDYSFDPEITNYLLVLDLDPDGALRYMTMES